jgi:hypothetical protein
VTRRLSNAHFQWLSLMVEQQIRPIFR